MKKRIAMVLARKEKELTQIELAKKVKVTQATISKIESGEINPSLELAFKLVSILEVDINVFNPGDQKNLKTNIA